MKYPKMSVPPLIPRKLLMYPPAKLPQAKMTRKIRNFLKLNCIVLVYEVDRLLCQFHSVGSKASIGLVIFRVAVHF